MTHLAQSAYSLSLALLERVQDQPRDHLAREIAAEILNARAESGYERDWAEDYRSAIAELRDFRCPTSGSAVE